MNAKTEVSVSFSLGIVLTIILVILKACNVLKCSWLMVFSPILLQLIIIVMAIFLLGVIAIIEIVKG
nr:MAG TPA: hypothetical protein [Caudoviricetes sp.]